MNSLLLRCSTSKPTKKAMDDASSWTGSSWRLTGALTRLSERNMFRTDTPPVVVLIPSMEGNFFLPGLSRRHSEYGDYTNPISQAYGKFVAEVLHPYIVDRFRIKDDVEHVATIGSSLGGQASLQLLLRYPTIFGAAACLSPCFQPGTIAAVIANIAAMDGGRGRLEKVRTMDHPNRNSLRSKVIYMDIGGDVDVTRVPIFDAHDHFTMNDKFWNPGYWWLDTNLQPMVDAMRLVLDGGGVQHTYKTFPGGRHNERAWAQRIHHP
jgi:S-formylglutathione hydrolase FrmB